MPSAESAVTPRSKGKKRKVDSSAAAETNADPLSSQTDGMYIQHTVLAMVGR